MASGGISVQSSMPRSWVARLSVMATIVALSPARATAECPIVALSYSMEHAEVVFAGTVIRTDTRPEYPGYRIATFKVDGVWKGKLEPEVTLSEANMKATSNGPTQSGATTRTERPSRRIADIPALTDHPIRTRGSD